MGSGVPDILGFFETLDECVDCNFNDKFTKYADYLSIAKIDDTVYVNNKPVSKNVDYVTDTVGTEYFEVTLGSEDAVVTIVRFTYKPLGAEFIYGFVYIRVCLRFTYG